MNLKEKAFTLAKRLRLPIWRLYLVYRWSYRLWAWWKTGDPHFFRGVQLEISTRCNRRCSYCPNRQYGKSTQEYMSDAVLDAVLADLRMFDFAGTIYLHFYNEPLLHPGLEGIVARIKAALPRCFVSVYTNGDVLTADRAGALIAAGVSEFLVTDHNMDDGAVFAARIRPIIAAYPAYIRLQSLRGHALDSRTGLVDVGPRAPMTRCESPHEFAVVDVYGDVLLCCNDYMKTVRFGNVKDRPLREIWAASGFRFARDELRQGRPHWDACRRCFGISRSKKGETH